MEVRTRLRYAVHAGAGIDGRAREVLVVAVKGTWRIGAKGTLAPADVQQPLELADRYRGEPGLSSLVAEGETGPVKPATDVVLLGHARVPKRGTREVIVSLQVGSIQKRMRAQGARRWRNNLGLGRLSAPEPFEAIPLVWEHAYGGIDPESGRGEERNPLGRGFRAVKHSDDPADAPPNLDDPADPFEKPGASSPWNVGFVAPHWLPRRRRAGTYDERWMAVRAPLLPDDFDVRFHHTVSDDQIAAQRLVGGEPFEVVGATHGDPLRGQLPRDVPVAFVDLDDRVERLALALDTVTIDADAAELRLLWKGTLPVHRELLRVQGVRIMRAAARDAAP